MSCNDNRYEKYIKPGWWFLIFWALTVLAGCGGGGSSSGSPSSQPAGQDGVGIVVVKEGTFVDSPVEGLTYSTETQSGNTSAEGRFRFLEGETVAFFIEDLRLGDAPAKETLTPLDIVDGAGTITHPTVTNIGRILQSLDLDGNPDNGITLTPAITREVVGRDLDFTLSAEDFAASQEVQGLFDALNAGEVFEGSDPRTLCSAEQAQDHLRASLQGDDFDGDGYTLDQGDCDDQAAATHPRGTEICGDGIDQDCSGSDLPCASGLERTWYLDEDGDGYAEGTVFSSGERPPGAFFASDELLGEGGDCNDGEADVHPGAAEICGDNIDQDCNGEDLPCPSVDERTWYLDADGDGYSEGRAVNAQSRPSIHYFEDFELILTSGDCNDSDGDTHPQAAEICGDGIDQDCSGSDPKCPVSWYLDGDGDGYSDGTAIKAVVRPSLDYYEASQLTATAGDCNESDALVHPGAEDLCGDGIDQDCSGDDLPCPPPEEITWYLDGDGDGYSDGTAVNAPSRPSAQYYEALGLSATNGDCDDNDAATHPGAKEICGDGVDQNCTGGDLTCPTSWYLDADGDGYAKGTLILAENRPSPDHYQAFQVIATSGDCNDRDETVHPQAEEICGDGIDQDCSGNDLACPLPEEVIWYLDADGDGYSDGTAVSAANRPTSSYFEAHEVLVTTGDCNDSNGAIYPGAEEICGDGIDQDCSGGDLDCPVSWYLDVDRDGYSEGTVIKDSVRPSVDYFKSSELSETSGDCNDSVGTIHPQAVEVCGDGIDQDCNGSDLACPVGESEFEYNLRALVNDYRQNHGLGTLEYDPHLHDLAEEHSAYMDSVQVMSHDGFNDRYNRSGYGSAVENVGWNYKTPEAQFEGWRNSDGHNKNMLSSKISHAGISKVGPYVTFFACGNKLR